MNETLKRIRALRKAGEDVPDELMDQRYEELRHSAEAITAKCCPDSQRIWSSKKPALVFGASYNLASEWIGWRFFDHGPISFCPYCGVKLPDVRVKAGLETVEARVAAGIGVCRDGLDDACAGCGEDRGCICDPPEAAYEVAT